MIRILLDSSADLTLAECKEQGFDMVPLRVTVAGKSYEDGVNLDKDEFYTLLAQGAEFPHTSQPSPEDFLHVFLDAKQKGDDVLCILLSSALSGICQSARLAQEMAEYDRITIVDSLTATGAIRILAEHAKLLAGQGCSVPEIVEALRALRSRICIFASLDTLEYLAKGGRLNKATATVGNMFHLKPLITVSPEGTVDLFDKQIGKVRAMEVILRQLDAHPVDPAFPFYSVYSNGLANLELFEKRMLDAGFAPTARTRIGSAIGAHIGPGGFGVIYVEKQS